MKKTLSIVMVSLIALSTYTMFAPHVTALSECQLTTSPFDEGQGSWNPDGTRVVFLHYTGGWYRYLKAINFTWCDEGDCGSGEKTLTGPSVVDHLPKYSPDGTKILFMRWGFRGDRFDLVLMNADGTNVQKITDSSMELPEKVKGSFEHPSWSEDGTKLVFHYREGTTGGPDIGWWVCTANIDDTGQLTNLQVRGQGMHPSFGESDSKIIFVTDYTDPDGQRIAKMNADGTDETILTDGPDDNFPHMSSITNRIVFTRNRDLYVMNEDGSCLELISSDGTISWPEWSLDEKYILYGSAKSGNGDLWVMEAPSVEVVEATADIDPDTLNLKSNGQWITAYIELPEEYSPAEIDVASVLLNGSISVDPEAPTEVGDYDGDSIPDLTVKFQRALVIEWLGSADYGEDTGKSVDIALVITGEAAGTPFEGADTIRVLLKG